MVSIIKKQSILLHAYHIYVGVDRRVIDYNEKKQAKSELKLIPPLPHTTPRHAVLTLSLMWCENGMY